MRAIVHKPSVRACALACTAAVGQADGRLHDSVPDSVWQGSSLVCAHARRAGHFSRAACAPDQSMPRQGEQGA
eukprot:3052671-Pleurochrysis_carterae.AAC.1